MHKYNVEQIKEIIPHRYEMLLVDEVEIIDDVTLKGRVVLSEDKWFFKGHFPGNPVMPGVLQIEAAAQVGAVALLSKPENKGKTGYFAAIDKAKFRKMLLPGDELTIEVIFTKIKLSIGKGEAKGYNSKGELAFSAHLTFSVM